MRYYVCFRPILRYMDDPDDIIALGDQPWEDIDDIQQIYDTVAEEYPDIKREQLIIEPYAKYHPEHGEDDDLPF